MHFQDPTGERRGTRSDVASLKLLMRRKRKLAGIKRFGSRRDQLEEHYRRKGIKTPEEIYAGPTVPTAAPFPQIGPYVDRSWIKPVQDFLDQLLRPNRDA